MAEKIVVAGSEQENTLFVSLRDLFAMAALSGLAGRNPNHPFEKDAEWCYKYADVMIKERAKHE